MPSTTTVSTQLHSGDVVLLYTDGVPETTNIAGEEYGEDPGGGRDPTCRRPGGEERQSCKSNVGGSERANNSNITREAYSTFSFFYRCSFRGGI